MGLPVTLVLVAAALLSAIQSLESYASSSFPINRAPRYSPEAARLVLGAGEERSVGGAVPLPVAFRPRETLSEVLDRLGLSSEDGHAVATALAEHADLRRLRPEDQYAAAVDDDGVVQRFELTLHGRGRVLVERPAPGAEDGWSSGWKPFDREVRVRPVAGPLSGALESSIESAGGPGSLAYLMSEVLQWDLDFNRDLQENDSFVILFEEVYLDGRFHSLGEIRALIYENRGRRIEAYRFGDPGGYYDADGRPLRKMFLRSPMAYSRITSRFSHRRFHPILKRYRPHYGVDYGAPTGTPARVTANGVVSFAGWDRGGGNTVKVRHPNGYLTAYLHLSRFAKGVRPGARVAQGEVIGYVGATGLATAPHLDYRVQLHGKWINPLELKSVPAEPIPDAQMTTYLATRDAFRDHLDEAVASAGERRTADRIAAR